MKVLASYSIKGGVGKTAGAVNLAHEAARRGQRTLLWDLDPQGASSFYFRIELKQRGKTNKAIVGTRALTELIRETDYEGLDTLASLNLSWPPGA